MGEFGTISFIPAFGAYQAGETVTVQALIHNLTSDVQKMQLGFTVRGTTPLIDVSSAFHDFTALQRTYLDAPFTMPDRSVVVDITLKRFNPRTFTVEKEDESLGWGVALWEPAPTPPPAPPETPTLPIWLRAFLLAIPILGPALLTLAEWLALNTRTVEEKARDLLTWIAKVEVDADANRATMGEWIELSSGRFAGNYEQWEAGTIEKAKSLIETSEASVVGQLWDWINPLNLWKDKVAPALSTVDEFLGDPWDWLVKNTIMGDLLTIVQIMWDTLVALPEDWSNFFWLPIDFLLNALDHYLYEEVE